MRDPELEARLNRLISGRPVPLDIERLLSGIRFRCKKQRMIRDFADFIDHRTAKSKGPAWQVVQDLLLVKNYHLTAMQENTNQRRYQSVDDIREIGLATLRLCRALDPEAPLPSDGRFERVVRKIDSVSDDGSILVKHELLKQDRDVFDSALSVLPIAPVMSTTQLWAEFIAVLLDTGLLKNASVELIEEQRSKFSVFVLAAIHNRTVDSKFGEASFELALGQNGELEVQLVPPAEANEIRMITSAIITDLSPDKWCDADMLVALMARDDQALAIEIGDDWIMRLIQ